jgi:hypothetical protein
MLEHFPDPAAAGSPIRSQEQEGDRTIGKRKNSIKRTSMTRVHVSDIICAYDTPIQEAPGRMVLRE